MSDLEDIRPVGGLDAITIDCSNPLRLSRFWADVLGTEIESAVGNPFHYVDLRPLPGVPILRFQRVPEHKQTKNRIHLDVSVESLDEAVTRVEALGGRLLSDHVFQEYDYRWIVMADLEDNEFCLVIRGTG